MLGSELSEVLGSDEALLSSLSLAMEPFTLPSPEEGKMEVLLELEEVDGSASSMVVSDVDDSSEGEVSVSSVSVVVTVVFFVEREALVVSSSLTLRLQAQQPAISAKVNSVERIRFMLSLLLCRSARTRIIIS